MIVFDIYFNDLCPRLRATFSKQSKKYFGNFFQSIVDAKGLKADEWVKAVSGVIGGKGGGKSVSAQGSGVVAEVNEVLTMASDFAKIKFL